MGYVVSSSIPVVSETAEHRAGAIGTGSTNSLGVPSRNDGAGSGGNGNNSGGGSGGGGGGGRETTAHKFGDEIYYRRESRTDPSDVLFGPRKSENSMKVDEHRHVHFHKDGAHVTDGDRRSRTVYGRGEFGPLLKGTSLAPSIFFREAFISTSKKR